MSRLSREVIAEAAIAIADEDGLDAVSMRRVAQRLEVGTMSLYHHVRDKQALFTAMADAIMQQQLIPEDEVPAGWRDGLAEIGRRAHALFIAHPWIVESWHETDRHEPGVSFVEHVEQTLSVVDELDFLSIPDRLELTSLVDEYVTGHALHNLGHEESGDRWRAVLEEQAATGAYPRIAQALEGDPLQPGAGQFERGLQIVLDGIEASVERRRP